MPFFRFEVGTFEAIQFQEAWADELSELGQSDPCIRNLHTVKLKPLTDKGLRIEKLSPLVQTVRIKIARKCATLYE